MLWRSNVIGISIILHKSLPWTIFFSSFPVEILFGGRSILVGIDILLLLSYPTWMFNFPICRTIGCYVGNFCRGIFFPLDPTCIHHSLYLEFWSPKYGERGWVHLYLHLTRSEGFFYLKHITWVPLHECWTYPLWRTMSNVLSMEDCRV